MVFVGLISLPKNLISFVFACTREVANKCELDSADKDYSFAFRLVRVCCQANYDYEIFVNLFFNPNDSIKIFLGIIGCLFFLKCSKHNLQNQKKPDF